MGKIKVWAVWLIVLVAVMLPVRSKVQQEKENQTRIRKMEMYLDHMGEDALERQKNLARWYNYNLELGTGELEDAYGSILNFGDGVMAVLEVPEMRVRLPVFHGENGLAGHRPDSDFPIGGRESHSVLTVKTWYPWEKGMTVYIDCLGSRYAYRVESVQVMPSRWPAEWPSEQERLTILHDRGNLHTMIRCVRCGELTVRPREERTYFLTVLLLIPAGILWKWIRQAPGRPKYPGFLRKNRRKSKLL